MNSRGGTSGNFGKKKSLVNYYSYYLLSSTQNLLLISTKTMSMLSEKSSFLTAPKAN